MKTATTIILYLCTALFARAYDLPNNDEHIINNAAQISIHAFDSDESGRLMIDHNGMLWMGSSNGLISFDGYLFKSYRSDAFTTGILPNNVVISLTEDLDDNIWIGTRDGLVKMDRRKGLFKTYRLPGKNQRIIYCLYTTKDGTVWIGTDGGLTRYDKKTDSFYTYNIDTYYSVKSIKEDQKGNLYIGTWDSGLMRLRSDRTTIDQYPQLNSLNSAYSLFIDSRQRLWIGTWEYGMAMIENPDNYTNPIIKRYYAPGSTLKIVNNIIEDPLTHKIWVCGREGIGIYDEGEDKFRLFEKYKYCGDIVTDNHGHIFVATVENGILKLDTNPRDYKVFPLNATAESRPAGNIESMYTADGRWFWLGLKPCGLALYDLQTGNTLYNMDIPLLKRHPEAANITKAIVPSIIGDKGKIWMANSSYGLYMVDGDDIRLMNTENTHFIVDDYVNCLFRDRDGNIWVGQRGGLSVVFPDLTGKQVILKDTKRNYSVCDVRNISQDKKGNIWIATDNEGIIRLTGNPRQPKGIRTKQYSPRHNNFVSSEAMQCLEDSRGRMWAVSNGGGLFEYNAATDCFEPRNMEYHITASRMCAITEDNFGCIWVSTDKAFLKLNFSNGKTPSIKTFPNEDGRGKRLASMNNIYKWGNELYLGGNRALLSITPKKPRTQAKPISKLIVTDIYIDDQPIKSIDSLLHRTIIDDTPIYAQKITIPPTINKFSIEFALLNYFNQDQTSYAYFLEGYDKDWHYIDATSRKATFENLPWGEYKLYIKATDNSGNTQELPYGISIHILPPWYATWWAFGGYIIMLVVVILVCVMWYRNYMWTKNRLQMAVVFTNITHELLTPLTVIKAVVDEVKAAYPSLGNEHDLINSNINKITRLLRQILEIRKSQAGQLKIKVSQNDLAGFISNICNNLRPMATAKNIDLTLRCDKPERLAKAWFDTDKVETILSNLISNSIKYGKEKGVVEITLTQEKGQATITIEDNGIGMNRQQMKNLYTRFLDGNYRKMKTTGTGIGLSLTHNLVQLHHGTIDCRSKENEGTLFTISLPIEKKAYADNEIEQTTTEYLATKALEENRISGYSLTSRSSTEDGGDREYTALVVEDNEELLNLMKHLLKKRYNVLTAKNGKQALRIIQREELDIVISDVMMPVMDGIELTRLIKNDKNYAQLPVILLTAKTQEEDKNKGYEMGADDYITKPFNLNDLMLRVENIIKNRYRIREKFKSQTEYKVEEQHYSNPDEAFVEKAIECIKNHLEDADYDRESFANDMCISSSTLYNKLRAITGQSVTGFITSVRLKEACRIARSTPGISVTELSVKVGFNTPKYFTKCFKKEFGMLLKEYLENESKQEKKE